MAGKLTARGVMGAKAGRHGDGGGLYLVVSPSGAKKWLFRFSWRGRVTEMGLGSADTVSLATARDKRDAARKLVADGRNPIEARQAESAIPTFGALADAVLESKRTEWRHPVHAKQWERTVRVTCAPIREIGVDKISIHDVLLVLKPIWVRHPETSNRARQRIEVILNAAKAKGYRTGENPAAWRGNLEHLLPKRQKISKGHYAAMAYDAVPEFMARLSAQDYMAALALRFLILTASRTKEVLGARWSEIDMTGRVWVIPKERMKSGREHRVPLSNAAMEILTELADLGGSYLFKSPRGDRPLSHIAMQKVLSRMGVNDATVHGFRSAFRDWAGNETSFPREVCEAALAHTLQGVEAAYRRSDALEKRRALMQAWGAYLTEKHGDKLIRLAR